MSESGDGLRYGRATRMSIFVVFLLAVSALGAPSLMTNGAVDGPIKNAAAADIDRIFTVGGVELAISTLNPFTYTMADEMMAIWPCYSTLLTYDSDGVSVIGDLATDWSMSSDGLTWHFNIVSNAYFCDPDNPTSTAHQVTADDVIYSYELVQNYTSNLHYYLPEGTLTHMRKLGTFELELVLSQPFAPFQSSLIGIPIVPKYWWEPKVDQYGGPKKVKDVIPIGSSFFYYDLDGLPETGEVVLKRNPIWFQTENRGWQLHVDTFRFKDMGDANTAWIELCAGTIDCFMGVSPDVYVDELPGTPNVLGFAQSTGFVYTYNLNQMTDELRDTMEGPIASGENSQILLDQVVKDAMAMCVDKHAFVDDVLRGLGSVADSLITDISPWHYTYGTEPDEIVIPFNPDGARALLWENGWKYDAAGRVVAIDSSQCPLYGYVGDDLLPLEFNFYSLLPDPEWAEGSMLMADWAAQGGIKLNRILESYNEMNNIWYAADYDTWLWDWMFTPISDPSTDVLSVLTTMEIGSWSDVYWSDAEFDEMYNRSLTAMDPVARGEIVDELQRMAYEDKSCQCVAYRKELYAVSTQKWVNYGDWSTQWILMPDQCWPYLYMRISPNGPSEPNKNLAPVITSLQTSFEGEVNTDIWFWGDATDGSSLNYQWYWGDGTKSGWLTDDGIYHQYASDGEYTVYFAAMEMSGDDLYITSKKTKVIVTDSSNTAPYGLSISYSPLTPSTGDVITFTGSASDADGDELFYSWNFGDTYTGLGQVATHQYTEDGVYDVYMYVTDNHIGTGTRPQSTHIGVDVAPNYPPTIGVPDFTGVLRQVATPFSVTASDPDGDPLRYTWDWGDGSTTVNYASTATHTYMSKGVYTLTVSADDLSNLPGHNVTDTGMVQVVAPQNKVPVISAFSATNLNPYTGQLLTFTATASDGDGDPLRFTFVFGDGTQAVFQSGPTNPNQDVTFSVDKIYTAGGFMTASVHVWDFTANVTCTPLSINVAWNAAPDVLPMSDKSAVVDQLVTFSVMAYDDDEDPLTYTWDFGDGTPLAVGNGITHAYASDGEFVFRVWVDDAHGHNVTTAAIIDVKSEFEMNLITGWNLVTVPLVDHSYRASTLGLSVGDVVAGYNPSTKSYDKMYYVGISPSIYDFDIEPCLGYWVSVASSKTLTLSGYQASGMVYTFVNVPAGGGWAILGVPSLDTGLMASDVAAMYEGDISAVAAFNAVTKTYQTYYPAIPPTDFVVAPGSGMWLMCLTGEWFTYVA
jgi:ABC-type transport system substrate-binding protein